MLEAYTNSFQIAKKIRPFVNKVIIADTRKLKIISITNKKTDKVNAEKIARILKIQTISKENLVNEVYIPSEEIQSLRSLFTTYKLFSGSPVSLKNRLHSMLKENLIVFPRFQMSKKKKTEILNLDLSTSLRFQIELLVEEFDSLEDRKSKSESQIKLVGKSCYNEIELLTSIEGISILSALVIMADACDITRFPNKKHLCSYLRSAPAVASSNESTIIKRKNKSSRKLTMNFLTQSVVHFKRGNPKLKSWYEMKTKNTRKGKIRMATCRKIITQIYCILKNEEYDVFLKKNCIDLQINAA